MEKYHITLTDHRGRFSYLHPDRNRNITEQALGTDYCKDYLMELFEQNQNRLEAAQDTSKTEPLSDRLPIRHKINRAFLNTTPIMIILPIRLPILFIKSDLRLVVDLQNNVKARQSRAYAQKVKISNLQQMAKTIAYVQEHHYDTKENLQMTFDDISEKCKEYQKELWTVCSNVDSILGQAHVPEADRTQNHTHLLISTGRPSLKFEL